VKYLLYACVAILLITSLSLALVVKGTQQANQELRQQLITEEQRYNRLKQTIAEEKVVIVDAEERTRHADMLATQCRLELDSKIADAEEARECEDRVSRGLGVIETLTKNSTMKN